MQNQCKYIIYILFLLFPFTQCKRILVVGGECMEWEELYKDKLSSIHISGNKIIVLDVFKLTMRVFETEDEAIIEATVLVVGFKMRKETYG